MASNTLRLTGIAPFFIVEQHRASVDYYRTQLGFEPVVEVPEDPPFFALVQRDGAAIALKEIGSDVLPVPNWTRHAWARWDAFVTVSDPDVLYAEYCAKGVAIHAPIADTDDGLRAFEIRDINGYVLCFGRPLAPSDPLQPVSSTPGAAAKGVVRAPIQRGELFWLGPDASGEPVASAAHPHVVVQDDVFNQSRIATVVVCALTSNLHRANEPGNVLLDAGEGDLPQRSVVIVSQIASVEKARLGERIGALSEGRVDQILAGLRFQQASFFAGRT